MPCPSMDPAAAVCDRHTDCKNVREPPLWHQFRHVGIVAGAAREWPLWRPGRPACTAWWTPARVLAGAPGDPGVPACRPLCSSLVGGPNAVGHDSHDRDFSVVVL